MEPTQPLNIFDILFLPIPCINHKVHKIHNSKTFWGPGSSLEVNVSLRTTVIRADDAASPPGLLARQVYRALWWRAACRILRQQVPLIFVIMYSGELSMLWSSRYQDMVGEGIPVTWHSMDNGELSKTSTDFRFFVKSGGKICWCVSEIGIILICWLIAKTKDNKFLLLFYKNERTRIFCISMLS